MKITQNILRKINCLSFFHIALESFEWSILIGSEISLWSVLSVGQSVSRLVSHHFLQGLEVSLPCSYRSTCYFHDRLLGARLPLRLILFDWSPLVLAALVKCLGALVKCLAELVKCLGALVKKMIFIKRITEKCFQSRNRCRRRGDVEGEGMNSEQKWNLWIQNNL